MHTVFGVHVRESPRGAQGLMIELEIACRDVNLTRPRIVSSKVDKLSTGEGLQMSLDQAPLLGVRRDQSQGEDLDRREGAELEGCAFWYPWKE